MGSVFQIECANMENKVEGLRMHLVGNFYPPHPKYVVDSTIDGFEKYWNGDIELDELKDACYLKDIDGLFKYYGYFLD